MKIKRSELKAAVREILEADDYYDGVRKTQLKWKGKELVATIYNK